MNKVKNKLKKLPKMILCSIMAACLLASNILISVADTNEKKPLSNGISPISGTFIQPWMYGAWDEARWDKELIMLKELGIEYMVMGDVAEKPDKSETWNTFYQSNLPEVGKMNYEALDMLFKMCDKHGIKLYLGMGVDHQWWGWDLSSKVDGDKFIEAAKMSVKFANELHTKYKKKYPQTYYGFYSVYEIWNHTSWNDPEKRTVYADTLSKGFNIIINGLNKIDPTMPLLFSPFATPTDSLASLENTQAFYTDFFTKTNFRKFDAFSPMDNIGGGGQKMETVEPWYKAYAAAINSSGNKLKFWSNVESFIQPDDSRINGKNDINYWGACTVSRLVSQIEMASKYCERIFNFAYPHYFSPYNNVAGYHEAYKAYLQTGKGDQTKPIPPNKLSTKEIEFDGKTYLKLEWSGLWDDFGISRVNIYKNGSLIDYRPSSRNDGGSNAPDIPNFAYDTTLTSASKFMNYEIEVVDCWGNVSDRAKFRVYYEERNNEIPLDEPYFSTYKDEKLAVSAKPIQPFPTEYVVKDVPPVTSGGDVESKMAQVYSVGILILFSVFLVVFLTFIFIKRKSCKKQ